MLPAVNEVGQLLCSTPGYREDVKIRPVFNRKVIELDSVKLGVRHSNS